MRTLTRVLGLLTLAVTAACSLNLNAAVVQRRGAPPHVPSHRGVFVFVGGYFYDPFFGPWPWWPHGLYRHPYFPIYDTRAEVRLQVTPREAAVYVDGFYAGIVDDFDGFFQRLPLPPGGHEVVLYLEGYSTTRDRIYLSPGSTFRLEFAMERLRPGEASDPPVLAPPIPPPPEGTFLPPRTAPPRVIPVPAEPASVATGTLVLRVQPTNADVLIDGERWMSSDGERFTIELSAGRHRVQVTKAGYQPFATEIEVQDGESTSLNVSLIRRLP